MKPKRYPYLGKAKLIRKELPRFVRLGDVAIKYNTIKYITEIKQVAPNQTMIFLRVPDLFLNFEKKEIRVRNRIGNVIDLLNQY
ncbi:hypothetical protein [Streptococcus agalactiae]|uniref:hypothetical protein n=1 Tax=Streptococcus agalactiae TaxID=1311 RepID=UPI00037B5030|nr:hypothetical protein [Streptococcus agalactiae]EPV90389.1 hypothetical protein SAG0023_07350 [Streptococcus agalactiae FSL S3-105]